MKPPFGSMDWNIRKVNGLPLAFKGPRLFSMEKVGCHAHDKRGAWHPMSQRPLVRIRTRWGLLLFALVGFVAYVKQLPSFFGRGFSCSAASPPSAAYPCRFRDTLPWERGFLSFPTSPPPHSRLLDGGIPSVIATSLRCLSCMSGSAIPLHGDVRPLFVRQINPIGIVVLELDGRVFDVDAVGAGRFGHINRHQPPRRGPRRVDPVGGRRQQTM